MTHVLGTKATVEDDANLDKQARAAVAAFTKLLPTLNGYVKALTGDSRIQIQISKTSNGETDGRVILLRPPIALGLAVAHEYRRCNKRDSNKQQMCKACAQRESVLLKIYHETSHIAYNSFEKPDDEDVGDILNDAIRASGSYFAKKQADRLKSTRFGSYIEMATAISAYLPLLLNVLEDARIDLAMFRARPGIKPMYEATLNETRDMGIEIQDPNTGKISYRKWSEQPLDYQAMFCCYAIVTEYDATGWFAPEVNRVIEDEPLHDMLLSIRRARSAREVYRASLPVLERLRELGFCKLPEDPPEEEEKPETPENEDEKSDDKGDKKSESDSSSDSREDDSDSEEDDDTTQEDDSSTEEDSEEETPQEEVDTDSESGDEDDNQEDSDVESGSDGSSEPDGSSDESDSGSGSSGDDPDEDESGGAGQSSPGSAEDEDSDEGDLERDEAGQESETGADGNGSDPAERDDREEVPDSDSNGDVEDGASGESRDHDNNDEVSEVSEGDSDELDVTEEAAREHEPVDPSGAEEYLIKAGGHDDTHGKLEDNPDAVKAIVIAIVQGEFFDTPSRNITQVREIRFDSTQTPFTGWASARRDKPSELNPDQSILGQALMEMRRAFTENAKHSKQPNLRSGRVNTRVLGRRAALEDDRLFTKRNLPGQRRYEVILGLDISGSTMGKRVEMIKKAAFAQAELCNRMGIDFSIYAHSGSEADGSQVNGKFNGDISLDMHLVKEFKEAWNDTTKRRLGLIRSSLCNLDGHTLEYYRKTLDKSRFNSRKIIVYYTDGAMPAENYAEELSILQREIAMCKIKGYSLLFVGVQNDEPKRRYGLDMVRLDEDKDVINVVRELGKRISIK